MAKKKGGGTTRRRGPGNQRRNFGRAGRNTGRVPFNQLGPAQRRRVQQQVAQINARGAARARAAAARRRTA